MANGRQRYECKDCKRTFNSLSNTILSNTKKPISEWEDYVLYITNELTIKAASEIGGVNKNTSYLWRRKFFQCVSDYQSRVELGGDVWIDEIYFNVPSREMFVKDGDKLLRGISRNKIAVDVAIDSSGNSYCKVLEIGKPTSGQILSALKDHIAKGSRLFHDGFNGHAALTKEVGGIDYVYNTSDPRCMPMLQRVNELCSFLKRIVMLHVGQKRRNLQSYLDWACFRHKVCHMQKAKREKFLLALCCSTKVNYKRGKSHHL